MTSASAEGSREEAESQDLRTVSLPIARRTWTTVNWVTQIFVWGLQILIRLDDDGGPQWLLYTSVVFLCVAIVGLISTWFIRVEYEGWDLPLGSVAVAPLALD